jgi:hypothetical protein
MKRLSLVVLFATLSACQDKAPAPVTVPVKGVVAGLEMIDYQEPSGAFEIQGPGVWQVHEDSRLGPSVMLLGPGTAKFPRSVSISVSRYPNTVDKSPDPKSYYSMLELISEYKNISAYTERAFGSRKAFHFSFESPFRRLHEYKIAYQVREDVAIIPFDGGFFKIRHHAPVDIYKETLPVFEAVVASFKPGKLPAKATKP